MVTIVAILLNNSLHCLLHWESTHCGGSCWPLSPDMHRTDALVPHYTKASFILGQVLDLSFLSDKVHTSQTAEQVTGDRLYPDASPWTLTMDSLRISFYFCDWVGLPCARQSAYAHSCFSPMILLLFTFETLAHLLKILLCVYCLSECGYLYKGADAHRG